MAIKIKCCECGCRQPVKPGNRFIDGHSTRNNELAKKWEKEKLLIKYCKCGCENKIIIKPYHKYKGIPDYIVGHQNKGKNNPNYGKSTWNKDIPCTKETKRKISKTRKERLASGRIQPPNLRKSTWIKGKTKEEFPQLGCSKETRERMRISALKYIEETGYLSPRIGRIEPIFEKTVLKKIVGLKYETQKRINKIGIVDFFLPDFGIIIECDEKLHKETKQKSKDAERDFLAGFIFKYKYITIRFTDTEIVEEPKECIKEIKKCIRKKGT